MRVAPFVIANSLFFSAIFGCAHYDAPPEATIEGAVDGALTDPTAPLVLAFSEPVVPTSLRVTLARDDVDAEGNLPDERNPPAELDRFFERLASGLDDYGVSMLTDNDTRLRIQPSAALPVGPRLVFLLEEGLSDREGNATGTRRYLRFGYRFDLECNAPTMMPAEATFFMLVDVEKPLSTQVQLLANFRVDTETGKLVAQFANADRNKMLPGCPPCASTEVCRTLPAPACVAPSERAGTADEYPDFVPNTTPPTGFTFTGEGCAIDQPDGSVAFSIAPVDVIVQEPPVTLRNARMTAAFYKDEQGVLRSTGTLTADDVLLNGTSSGRGEGGLLARSIPEDEIPPGIPEPP